MPTAMTKAVILAAGRGTRMGSMTEETPKPMLTVGDRPMLEHILDRLSSAGVERFLIVVGYHREVIEHYFRSSRFNMEFVIQDPVNGTGSAALLARSFADQGPFLLTFGDILCASGEYVTAMKSLDQETQCVLAVKAVEDPWQGAAVYEEGGRILRIVEKPPKGTSQTKWNSAGFYCFRSIVFQYLAALRPSIRNEYELTSAIDAMLTEGLHLKISAIKGEWRDVGRPEDLAAVRSEV